LGIDQFSTKRASAGRRFVLCEKLKQRIHEPGCCK